MGEYVNPSNREFWISRKSEIFVDKSMLISYMNRYMDTANRFVCMARPRRFGKSTDAQMLAAYYSRGCDSAALFEDLKIASAGPDPYQNQCHVIFLNMQSFLSNSGNAEELISNVQEELLEELVAEIRKWVPDYMVKRFRPLNKAVACLARESHIPVIFIIDEWDCIFREYKEDAGAQKIYLDFLRDLLKDNASVSLVYMTGILPVKKYGTHSAINIFDEFSMIDSSPLAPFMGFTEKEVQKICSRYGKDFEQMRWWYDGYHLEHDISIYSPRSVVSSVLRDHYGCYWSQTETYEALRVYIDMNFDGLRDRIIRLLAGEKVIVETGAFENDMSTFKSADDVLTLLIHLGYLGYRKEQKTVYVPNREVRDIFVQSVKNSGWKIIIGLSRSFRQAEVLQIWYLFHMRINRQ